MNKRKLQSIMIFTILSVLTGLFPRAVFAENLQLTIDVHPQEVYQGEVFTIKLTFTSIGDSIGALDAALSYDKNLMEYQSGGSNVVQFSNGTGIISDYGSSSTKTVTYSFRFLAKKTGQADFSVTDSEVIGFDTGTLLGNPKGSILISIRQSENLGEAPSKDDPIEVSNNGKYICIDVDQEYILMPIDIIPEGYHPTNIEIDGKTISLLKPDDFKGLYLVQAMNKQGNTGYYFYDEAEGTMQRVLLDNERENRGIIYAITALAIICLILLVLIIQLSSSFKRRRSL